MHGAIYHTMARGNRKQAIFQSNADRRRFLAIVADASERYEVKVFGFSLMSNHFHLVVLTPRANISEFMRHVDGTYTQYSNWRHKRVGHLFQGPYKSVMVGYDLHLVTALSYVFMNPVHAGLVAEPSSWRWSSYRDTIGAASEWPFVCLEWLDQLFPAASREQSQRLLADFMSGPRTIESYLGKVAAGSEECKQRIRDYVAQNLVMARVPRSYKKLVRPTLDSLFPREMGREDRNAMIQRAHIVHGYTQAEIGDALLLHPGTISRLLCSVKRDIRLRVRDVEKRDLTPNSTSRQRD